MKYFNRVIDNVLQKYIRFFGATLLEGPKWCGKTTTAEQIANSCLKLQDPDMREEYLATAGIKPSLLLSGDTPRLIDEWQDAPLQFCFISLSRDCVNSMQVAAKLGRTAMLVPTVEGTVEFTGIGQ